MKKHFLLFLIAVSFAGNVAAQSPLTLRWQDYNGMPKNDRVSIVTDYLQLTQLNFYTPGNYRLWNMKGVQYNGTQNIVRDSILGPVPNNLPVYQYDEQETVSLGNIQYSTRPRFQRDTFGIVHIGDSVMSQFINISSITGTSTDNITIPAQFTSSNANLDTVIDFPASVDSAWKWVDFSMVDTRFLLTIAAAQYNSVPLIQRRSYTVYNTVIGWGRAVVNDQSRAGRDSDTLDVLQIKRVEVANNNYFTNGFGPVDPTILSILALQENSTDTAGYIMLVRKGETTPLLRVRYGGDPATSEPQMAWIQNYRLPAPLSTGSTLANTVETAIYPNPVRPGGTLSIDCTATGNWQLRLSAITGQQVLDARWSRANAGTEAVQMPQSVAPGMYIYQIFREGQPVKTGRILMGE